jgi:glycerophosphoryl diester phosphodiesterase
MRRRVVLIVSLLLLTAVAVLAYRGRPIPDSPFYGADDFLVIAHQGGDGLRPGNTMPAFAHAVELGVDVLEMDMHATADGVLVLMHDETVDRTTDGTGLIREMSFAALRELDAGYDWSTDNGATFPYRGQGIVVPALTEVLEAFPQMRFNIEIKQREPSIADSFCRTLREYGLTDRVLVASFHPESITRFRAACPEVATSAVEPEIRRLYTLNLLFLSAFYPSPATAFQVPEYSGDTHVVTPRFVRGAQGRNVQIHVWTVNETADMERMLELGVDGIITDRPDRLLSLVEE